MRSNMCCRVVWIALVSLMTSLTALAQNNPNREEPGVGRDPRLSEGQLAPILEGLGDHSMPITCKDARVQQFFDQGLRLTYGFNHKEAARAFQEALRLDPDCAMAYWGLALVNGPNLNMPLDEAGNKAAYEAIQKAIALKGKASAKEQAYIDAVAKRFEPEYREERADLNQAYSDAMANVYAQYPDDQDAASLYVDSLMNLGPWDYWYLDGKPYDRTAKGVEVLDRVLAANPKHPGALHYHIHLVEAQHPAQAEKSADTLLGLMPGQGHMQHMPSHIYMRIGRYEDAYDSNMKAIDADEGYITQCRAQGIYPLAYYPHNIHFLWNAATNLGKSAEAIAAAEKCGSQMTTEQLKENDMFQTFAAVKYFALTRFGKWDEILALPEPDEALLYLRAARHYARSSAFCAKGKLNDARSELKSLRKIVDSGKLMTIMFSAPPEQVLTIAMHCLEGEINAKAQNFEEAIYHLDTAVRLQDALAYNEPPDWHYPVRLSLGAVLLEADRAPEAEVVYWDELRRNPENGWTLFGLWKALAAQEKPSAAEIERRFKEAWKHADVELTASRF